MAQSLVLFKVSAGPSKRFWGNVGMGTYETVTCELCGKEWPEVQNPNAPGTGYTLGTFLGRQFIEECCGAAVDKLYEEFGEIFTLAFLKEFQENPGSERFAFFLFVLRDVLKRAAKGTEKVLQAVQELEQAATAVTG